MPSAGTLALFSLAALALIVVPGPAVLYIVAQSIDGGRVAGLLSALGVAVGGLVHATAAAIGLSALLLSSATAFTAVKLAGAAYLIGLGLYTLLVRKEDSADEVRRERRLRRSFVQGMVVNVLNPEDRALLHRVPAAVRRSRRAARWLRSYSCWAWSSWRSRW